MRFLQRACIHSAWLLPSKADAHSGAVQPQRCFIAPPSQPRQAKMREAEERRKQEAAAEKERRLQKTNAAGSRPKFSFKLGA